MNKPDMRMTVGKRWSRAEYFAHIRNKQEDGMLSTSLQKLNHDRYQFKLQCQDNIQSVHDSLRSLIQTTGYNQELDHPVKSKENKIQLSMTRSHTKSVRFDLAKHSSTQNTACGITTIKNESQNKGDQVSKFSKVRNMKNMAREKLEIPEQRSMEIKTKTHRKCFRRGDSSGEGGNQEDVSKQPVNPKNDGKTGNVDKVFQIGSNPQTTELSPSWDGDDKPLQEEAEGLDMMTKDSKRTGKALDERAKFNNLTKYIITQLQKDTQKKTLVNILDVDGKDQLTYKEISSIKQEIDSTCSLNSDGDLSNLTGQMEESDGIRINKTKGSEYKFQDFTSLPYSKEKGNDLTTKLQSSGQQSESLDSEAKELGITRDNLVSGVPHQELHDSEQVPDSRRTNKITGESNEFFPNQTGMNDRYKVELLSDQLEAQGPPSWPEVNDGINDGRLFLMIKPSNISNKRIIGRGKLEKPKFLLDREAALKIFNRTVSTAIANNKFKDNKKILSKKNKSSSSSHTDRFSIGGPKPCSSSAPSYRINQYMRAVEAGMSTDHLVPSVSTLHVPISKAWVRRERMARTKEVQPRHLDVEAEKERMEHIQERIRRFINNLDFEME